MSKRVSEGKSESMRERLSLKEKESGRESVCVCLHVKGMEPSKVATPNSLTGWPLSE